MNSTLSETNPFTPDTVCFYEPLTSDLLNRFMDSIASIPVTVTTADSTRVDQSYRFVMLDMANGTVSDMVTPKEPKEPEKPKYNIIIF